MANNIAETIAYRGLTIEIHYDSDSRLADALCDEPCAVLSVDRFGRVDTLHDNMADCPDIKIIRAIESTYSQDANEYLLDYFGFETKQTAKRIGFQDDDSKWHWFKDAGKMYFGLLKHGGFDNIRVKTIHAGRDPLFFVWDQSELDKYAGTQDAKPCTDSAESCLNGEVYGYWIKDKNGDDLPSELHDSRWGFVGDIKYCIGEAKSAADSIAESLDTQAARVWEQSRPDLYPQASA